MVPSHTRMSLVVSALHDAASAAEALVPFRVFHGHPVLELVPPESKVLQGVHIPTTKLQPLGAQSVWCMFVHTRICFAIFPSV